MDGWMGGDCMWGRYHYKISNIPSRNQAHPLQGQGDGLAFHDLLLGCQMLEVSMPCQR